MLLYKFRSLQQLNFLSDILLSERLYCPRYCDLNDPFEGVCTVHGQFGTSENPGIKWNSTTTIEDLLDPEGDNEVRVCSLSSSYEDVRMWSHYGGGHIGVAIEIDFDGAEDSPSKVEYLEGLKRYDESLGDHPSVRDILLNKTNHWEHEAEYRIISTKPYYSISGRIRRVLLGRRCTKMDAEMIKRLVPNSVDVISTKLNSSTTRVEIATKC